MTVRRLLPHLTAALLGVGAALLAACGAGTAGGVPPERASDLKREIVDVREAVDSSRCSDVPGQLKQVDGLIDGLPASTDDQLVRALRDGADSLRTIAVDECNDNRAARTQTTETKPQTTTQTTETETTPPPTATTETPTATTPPPTATTPAQTTPAPPQQPPPPPPGTPGGGTPPEVPPQ